MTEQPDFTDVRDAGNNTLALGTRIAYATLSYRSAYLRVGHVKAFRTGYGGRPEVLAAGDHGKSTWQRAVNVIAIREDV